MAERLPLDPAEPAAPPLRRYPWDQWLDGAPWRITSEDYAPASPSSFRAHLYATARARLLAVTVSCQPDGSITFRAYGYGDPRPRLPVPTGPNGKARPVHYGPSDQPPAPLSTLPNLSRIHDPGCCRYCGRPLNGNHPAHAEPERRCARLSDSAYRCPENGGG